MTEANGSPQPGFASIDTRLTWDTSIAYQPPSPSSVEPAPDFGRKPSNKRALNETRKLLSHVLAQLENRKTPASVVDTLMQATDAGSRGISAVAEKLKEVVKVANRSNSRAPVNNTDRQDESDEEDDGSEFTTDETYDLLLQLKDVLVIATAQGWAIFDDGSTFPMAQDARSSRFSSAFRRSRRVSKGGADLSPSASPTRGQVKVSELLTTCLSVLTSIVAEDCRFQIRVPRPSCPAFALQALVLSVAQYLVYCHRHIPSIVSQVAAAMIPAFATFPQQMYPRLLSFFESSIIQVVLDPFSMAIPEKKADTNASSDDGFTISVEQQEDPVVAIRIDDADDGGNASHVKSLTMQSTNNAGQPADIYRLAFIIAPLFSAILAHMPPDPSNLPTSFSRLLNVSQVVKNMKVDFYNDLLEVVAFQDTGRRRQAIALLSALYSGSLGHTIISNPLPFVQSPSDRLHSSAHQFIPWWFSPNRRHLRFGVPSHDDCRVCDSSIDGFGLLCPQCMTAVHLDCYDYPAGNHQIQYWTNDDQRVQRIAMHRFCDVESSVASQVVTKRGHQFRPTTWFTLPMCYVCRNPLWGHHNQGLRCSGCSMAVHSHCMGVTDDQPSCGRVRFTLGDFSITRDRLESSFTRHIENTLPSLSSLTNSGNYEEVLLCFSLLQSQLETMEHGLEMGSIVLLPDRQNETLFFALHRMKRTCSELLASDKLRYSTLVQGYLQDNAAMAQSNILYDWSFLEYLTSALKTTSPSIHKSPSSPDFLDVNPQPLPDEGDPQATMALELVDLAHLRTPLTTEFGLASETTVNLMVNHLISLHFVENVGSPSRLSPSEHGFSDNSFFTFPLPLGLDLSVNVETLVCAVEASLSDLDLSANECGFLLLTRRLWPNGLSSDFILKRLCDNVLLWILNEDESLAAILREFIAKQRRLPGVRDRQTLPTWPLTQSSRPTPNNAGQFSNGGEYVSARRALLARYATPWLLTVHNLNSELYAEVVFHSCNDVIKRRQNDFECPAVFLLSHVGGSERTRQNDDILRAIIKLSQMSVLFSVFDDVFLRWLEQAAQFRETIESLPSLGRLANLETDGTQKIGKTTSGFNQVDKPPQCDPMTVVLNLATHGSSAFSKSLTFLMILTKSGVVVQATAFKQFATLLNPISPYSIEHATDLLRCILYSLWLRSLGRQDVQPVIALIHSRMEQTIANGLSSPKHRETALTFVRLSLACCSLIYGCDRGALTKTGLIQDDEIQHLVARRKIQRRNSEISDPIIVESQILVSMEAYFKSNVDEAYILALKFIHTFLTESPFLESFEIDNFILRNSRFLTRCVWECYGIVCEDLAVARTRALLRCLVVDPEPLQDLLVASLMPSTPLHERLEASSRLFRLISDTSSPSFSVENSQWRPNVIIIFTSFFSLLWSEPDVLVRLSVQSACAVLSHVHFDAITLCWNEALSKSPVVDRLKLVSFLQQLHPHFPTWKVLSWEYIIEALDDSSESGSNSQSITQRTNRGFDEDVRKLRVATLLLAMSMLADGIEVDPFSILKIKTHLVQLLGFSKVTVLPSTQGHLFYLQFEGMDRIPDEAIPCIEELATLFDSPHKTEVPCSILGCTIHHLHNKTAVLFGAPFVDIALSIFSDLSDLTSLPVLALKSLMESLYIIIHKIDLDSATFQHLRPAFRKAILCAVELFSKELSYEIRQLSMSIAQATIKRWHSFLGATVANILIQVASEIATQGTNNDALAIQGKTLIVTTLDNFCGNGILFSLMRRELPPEFFPVLKSLLVLPPASGKETRPEGLCDRLLYDALSRTVECDSASLQLVLQNTLKFIEIVHNSNYSQEAMTWIGQQLVQLSRRMTDGTIPGVDCSPLIQIAVLLVEKNHMVARELLPYLDTILRTLLNRLPVAAPCLVRLVKVAGSPRMAPPPGSAQSRSGVVNVLFELLIDGFKSKTKITPTTMSAIIEGLETLRQSAISVPSNYDALFRNVAEDAYNFLQNHQWFDEPIENDFQAMFATAALLLRNTLQDPLLLPRLIDPTSEKQNRQGITLRSWNMLLLAALRSEYAESRISLSSHFSTFNTIYAVTLRKYAHTGISSTEVAIMEVNQAYVAMKLWIMLVHRVNERGRGDVSIIAVWNELWGPYDSFLCVLEGESRAGLHRMLTSLVSTSLADLLVYLRNLKTPLALDSVIHINILNRLKALSQGDSSMSKLNRTMKTLMEPPAKVDPAVLLDQTAKELIAAEKFKVIELRRDTGRATGERFRRDMRFQV